MSREDVLRELDRFQAKSSAPTVPAPRQVAPLRPAAEKESREGDGTLALILGGIVVGGLAVAGLAAAAGARPTGPVEEVISKSFPGRVCGGNLRIDFGDFRRINSVQFEFTSTLQNPACGGGGGPNSFVKLVILEPGLRFVTSFCQDVSPDTKCSFTFRNETIRPKASGAQVNVFDAPSSPQFLKDVIDAKLTIRFVR